VKEIKGISKDKGSQYIVTFTDKDKLKVNEDVLVKFRLLKGMKLTEKELEKIKIEADFQVGLQIALRFLNFQMRSEYELKTQLRQKEVQDIPKVLQRVKEMGFLDDELFAQSFVRTQKNTSDKGPVQIKHLLRQKGISSSIIELAIEEFPQEEQDLVAVRLADKLARKYKNKSYREALQKIRLSLMNKGFYEQSINKAMDELEFEVDDEEQFGLLKKQAELLWHKHRKHEGFKRFLKVKQSLYQKGFDLDQIDRAIDEVRAEDE